MRYLHQGRTMSRLRSWFARVLAHISFLRSAPKKQDFWSPAEDALSSESSECSVELCSIEKRRGLPGRRTIRRSTEEKMWDFDGKSKRAIGRRAPRTPIQTGFRRTQGQLGTPMNPMKYALDESAEQSLLVRDYRPEGMEENFKEGKSVKDDPVRKTVEAALEADVEEQKIAELGLGVHLHNREQTKATFKRKNLPERLRRLFSGKLRRQEKAERQFPRQNPRRIISNAMEKLLLSYYGHRAGLRLRMSKFGCQTI